MLTRIGMDLVPPALSPDIKGLFEPSQDPTPLTLTETAEFRTINGELIHVLPQRHEVRKVNTHLLTRGESPDKGDYLKQFNLLRSLHKILPRNRTNILSGSNQLPQWS
jgi:hypothetical protein